MALSVFDIFKIGIGPSSSHTVGPMRAARNFARNLDARGLLPRVASLNIHLYGSLAETGAGHRTDMGIMLGLMGEAPDTVDPASIGHLIDAVIREHRLTVWRSHTIVFDPQRAFSGRVKPMPEHPNGMRFVAQDAEGSTVLDERYVSIGGGFIRALDSIETDETVPEHAPMPYPFATGAELMATCRRHGLTIAQLMMANESTLRPPEAVRAGVLHIARVMDDAIDRGCGLQGPLTDTILPGGLKVRRRAPALYAQLTSAPKKADDVMFAMDWVNLYAMAVNEENAASGRVVTAPTNGAAGLLPAVLRYYRVFVPGWSEDGVVDFLLTAAAIGFLYKENASISGAEVGCQGEVGVACSMAAAGLTAVLGGTVEQIENAAEIGMEHNLGLTCDPVGGLVQIPCIERNAMGGNKAINASRLALHGDGKHHVSLDTVIETMRQTGADMQSKYKETSRGGLAVNVVEC
ncbi:MAG: L-serine ammonia-lyase [Castellaniella sp.]|uniref:L-serine ammonia-lyase n=1 Tax=Castellaniella sp. TaxID=1955812 RepID=UPI002A363554|nr:L-serine ammonia-lyase [Castellaniella sp.]MDY0309218.1 L-serine ammonia-lyase [Castellaniella sp.]